MMLATVMLGQISNGVGQFGVASRSGDQRAVEQGVRWLQGAMTELGLGGKTAAGYGYWIIDRR